MPFASVRLVPGVNTLRTPTLNEAGYSDAQFIRWKDGLAQKIGGWEKFYAFTVGGIPRDIHAWEDLNSTGRLAVGTTTELDIITNGVLQTITPQQKTTSFLPKFTTILGSPIVNITDLNIGTVTTFDSVYFNTPISVGGLILSGLYPITLSVAATQYRITASSNATSAVTNGGAVPAFTTTGGSGFVNVALAAHGQVVGNAVNFPISTTVGGVIIQGSYTVVAFVDANNFTISANASASSTATVSMNAGQAQIVYDIAIGPGTGGTGYSIGGYSSGGYSTGSTPGAQTGTPITTSDWTFDNWGSYLLACPSNGGIYYWLPDGGFQTAKIVTNAPPFNGGIFVAMPAQILVAWGASVPQNIGVDQDPLMLKWSDQIDFLTWTPTSTNQAGSLRVPTGSRIVGGLQASQSALIWTDIDLYAMQYVGPPLVFGLNKIGDRCGLISSHGATTLGGRVFWMGRSNFYTLTASGATVIPCTVWDSVFQDLDMLNAEKVRSISNSAFNEIWFAFPSLSGGTGENDTIAKLNVVEGSWDVMPLARSAGGDVSVLGNPLMTTSTGLIYQHETGEDDDGQPIAWSFRTGYWSINDAAEVAFVDWFLPDMRWGLINGAQTAQVQITFFSRYYPGGPVTTHGPYTVGQNTSFINPRIRGRELAIEVSGDDIGSFVRLGLNRYRFGLDGRL